MSADVITVSRYLHSIPALVDHSYSLLVRLFLYLENVFDVIGWACAKEGRPQFVLDAFDEARSIADKDDREEIKIFLPYMIAQIKYTYYGLKDDCVELLEAFLQRLSQSERSNDIYGSYERKHAQNLLAQLSFDAAVDSWTTDSTSRPKHADKLKTLASAVSTGYADDYEGFDFFHPSYPAMLWGRWLKEFMRAEESKWRKCFRARLLEELNTIDDDDPKNDKAGLESLAVSLFLAGDRKNAGAIMAILFLGVSKEGEEEEDGEEEDGEEEDEEEHEPAGTTENISDESSEEDIEVVSEKPEEQQDEKSEGGGDINRRAETPVEKPAPSPNPEPTSTPNQPPPEETANKPDLKPDQVRDDQPPHLSLNMQGRSTRSYHCGHCRRHFREVAEMYVCEVCSSTTNWCGECLPLLRDEEQRMAMVEFKCNPRHPFYLAWPVPDEAKHVAASSFEKGVMVRREWLKKLRQEWWERSVVRVGMLNFDGGSVFTGAIAMMLPAVSFSSNPQYP